MGNQPVDLGTQVRNAALELIKDHYSRSRSDADGWGAKRSLHSGRMQAYGIAVALFEKGEKSLEEIKDEMEEYRSRASSKISDQTSRFCNWDRFTEENNRYNQDYVNAADNVIEILDRILGKK